MSLLDRLQSHVDYYGEEVCRDASAEIKRLMIDRAAVIEECARIVEDHLSDADSDQAKPITAAIRALKDKP